MKYIQLDADTAALRTTAYDGTTGFRVVVYSVMRSTAGLLGYVPNGAIFTETDTDVFATTLLNPQVNSTFGAGTLALIQADFDQDYN